MFDSPCLICATCDKLLLEGARGAITIIFREFRSRVTICNNHFSVFQREQTALSRGLRANGWIILYNCEYNIAFVPLSCHETTLVAFSLRVIDLAARYVVFYLHATTLSDDVSSEILLFGSLITDHCKRHPILCSRTFNQNSLLRRQRGKRTSRFVFLFVIWFGVSGENCIASFFPIIIIEFCLNL